MRHCNFKNNLLFNVTFTLKNALLHMRDKKDLGKNASENMLFLPRPLRYDLAWSGA